jgi:hypothetical protein
MSPSPSHIRPALRQRGPREWSPSASGNLGRDDRRDAHVAHARDTNEFLEVLGHELRAVVRDDSWRLARELLACLLDDAFDVQLRHPPRVVGTVTLSLLGVLEVLLFVLALRSERSVPAATDGLAFEVPRAVFDVDHIFLASP